MYTELFK